ncbi:MAG: DUF4349 domain-containing protein [Ruminococcus sp.]|jgi:hypothetical protein|nr:DUF4349 domain-containing protein [Ruminococcus sp.]
MKKIIIPLILILALAGCSGASSAEYAPSAAAAAGDGYSNSSSDVMYVTETASEYYDQSGENLPAAGEQIESEKMIIRNAELTIQTLNIDDTYNKLTGKLYELGGSIFAENSYKNDFSAEASLIFKIPPQNLDKFLAYAEECGNVTNKNVTSEDITSQYIDTEIRLENKKRNLEKYYGYLDEATRSSDVIAIQNEIDRITSDIESYQGMLNYWSRSVSESTVNIEIRQLQDPNEIEIEDVEFSTLSLENMGKIMANGVKKCADVIVTILQWILIVIVTLSPVILLAAVIVTIIILIVKRKKRVKKQQIEEVKPEEDKTEEKTK